MSNLAAVLSWLDNLASVSSETIAVQRVFTQLLQQQLRELLGIGSNVIHMVELFSDFLLYGTVSELPQMQEQILQVLGYQQASAVRALFTGENEEAITAALAILVYLAIANHRLNEAMHMLNMLVLKSWGSKKIEKINRLHLVAQFEGATRGCDLPPVSGDVLWKVIDALVGDR